MGFERALNPTCTHLFSIFLNATPEIANRRCSQVLVGLARLLRLISDMGHHIAGLYGSKRFSCGPTSSSFTVNAALVMLSTPQLFHIKLLMMAAAQDCNRAHQPSSFSLVFSPQLAEVLMNMRRSALKRK